MPYVIVTREKPNSLSVRTENRAVHLDYLNQHKAKLLAAGGLIEDDGTGGTGGVIIYDTDERAEAERFIQNDPFTKAGLFEWVQVTRGEGLLQRREADLRQKPPRLRPRVAPRLDRLGTGRRRAPRPATPGRRPGRAGARQPVAARRPQSPTATGPACP